MFLCALRRLRKNMSAANIFSGSSSAGLSILEAGNRSRKSREHIIFWRTDSGDCAAAAHSPRPALASPGCCFRCTLPKKDWLVDDAKIATARQRNFLYPCAASHVNQWPLLPGHDADGNLWSASPPPASRRARPRSAAPAPAPKRRTCVPAES